MQNKSTTLWCNKHGLVDASDIYYNNAGDANCLWCATEGWFPVKEISSEEFSKEYPHLEENDDDVVVKIRIHTNEAEKN